jgi:uncharacterized protein (TIGR04255 family)
VPRSARSRFNLVDFERPPVAEVILAVQFPAETVDLEAYGIFAQQIREELPTRTRQALVAPVEETFDRPTGRSSLEIRLEGPTSLPRIVFESEDGVQLVQLQPHRLTLNWRGQNADAEYPRYELLRRRFRILLKRLTDALDDVGQPHPINLGQVTYVNPIEYPGAVTSDGVGATHPDLAKIINRLRPRSSDAFLPEAEDAHLQARWRIPAEALGSKGGSPAGRLHLSVGPGLRPPGETPIYLVNLTAHVMPRGGSVDKAIKALDVGHEWVVRGFEDLTTSEMHKHWGLRRK